MNRRNTVATVLLAASVMGGLAACSSHSDEAAGGGAATATAAGSASDVAFAQSMMPHHQQAVEMADLALDPKSDASPQVKALAKQIKAAQDPEIQQMSTWLAQWGASSAMPSASGDGGDMAGMDHGGHDMGGITMSGMMTAEDMAELSGASGKAFDTLWLQMMIAHHEGAVQMAEQVKAGSGNPEVTALADSVIAGQTQEIETMQNLLAA